MPGRIRAVTLVVDKNPAPVAAVFRLGDGIADPTIGTRVRVNEYTNIHAVAETEDGSLFMAAVFVKAAGGCSAPASKTPDQAEAHLGEMRTKNLDAAPDRRAEPGRAADPAPELFRHADGPDQAHLRAGAVHRDHRGQL